MLPRWTCLIALLAAGCAPAGTGPAVAPPEISANCGPVGLNHTISPPNPCFGDAVTIAGRINGGCQGSVRIGLWRKYPNLGPFPDRHTADPAATIVLARIPVGADGAFSFTFTLDGEIPDAEGGPPLRVAATDPLGYEVMAGGGVGGAFPSCQAR